jgi:hypothetical protein
MSDKHKNSVFRVKTQKGRFANRPYHSFWICPGGFVNPPLQLLMREFLGGLHHRRGAFMPVVRAFVSMGDAQNLVFFECRAENL